MDVLAGGLVLLVVIQVAAARLRAMARERLAAARSLELVESKNRALEAFAARAAHDLRSPLVPIHSLASLIVRAGRDEADVRLASRIVGSASRMSAVIDAMLAFSRSGLLPRGRTEVRSAVTEALEDLGAGRRAARRWSSSSRRPRWPARPRCSGRSSATSWGTP